MNGAALNLDDLQSGGGPLYLKLRQTIEDAINGGRLKHGDALPPERDIAESACVSRVTVRKAVDDLVRDGLLVRFYTVRALLSSSPSPVCSSP